MINKTITNFKAVIFDMDGVIVDSEPHWEKYETEILKKTVGRWTKKNQKELLGLSLKDTYKFLKKYHHLSISQKQFFSLYHLASQQIYGKKAKLVPGVRQLIQALTKQKIPLALASSSLRSWISLVLKRFDLKKYFPITVSSEDINGTGKPSPRIYLHTANLLKIQARSCLVIEDSTNGIKSAKSANMKCISVGKTSTPPVLSDKHFLTHKQILNYIITTPNDH